MKDLFQTEQIRLTPSFLFPQSPYTVPIGQSFLLGMSVAADGLQGTHVETNQTVLIDTERTNYQPGRWPFYALEPGEYKFKFDGRDLFVMNVWGIIAEMINQDDPENTTFEPLSGAVYGGSTAKTSDNLKLKISGLSGSSVSNYVWSVSGPGSESYTPPGSAAEWDVGEIKPVPGILKFKVEVSFTDGTKSQITKNIEVGIRTDDIAVIAWINPDNVRLDDSGVAEIIRTYYPPLPGGPAAMSGFQKFLTLAHLGILGSEGAAHSGKAPVPPPLPEVFPQPQMTDAEKLYILHWLFHYAGNFCPQKCPPSSFSSSSAMENFRVSMDTSYKLYNRFQMKYLTDGINFRGIPEFIHQEIGIGSTDDLFTGPPPYKGQPGPNNNTQEILASSAYRINDGSPV